MQENWLQRMRKTDFRTIEKGMMKCYYPAQI